MTRVTRARPTGVPSASDLESQDYVQFTVSQSLVMNEISCSALLFDLDGVLINSTPAVARVWWQWAVEHSFNPEEVVTRAHGRPSLATVREYLPKADHEAENR